MINAVAIVSKKDLEKHHATFAKVVRYLEGKQKKVFLEERVGKMLSLKQYEKFIPGQTKVDLILVMGGDGTILRVLSELKDFKPRFLGINLGHLGFLSEIPPAETEKTLDKIFEGKYTVDRRMMIQVELFRQGKKISWLHALNEVAISQGTLSRLLNLKTKIDGRKLVNFRADGLLVATPTGSTAYSLSAGGPIVHPALQAMILTPVCPHSFSQKPIVIPDDKIIEIIVESDYKLINMTIDGQQNVKLKSGDLVKIQRNGNLEFLRLPSEHYFMNLRNKLGWGE